MFMQMFHYSAFTLKLKQAFIIIISILSIVNYKYYYQVFAKIWCGEILIRNYFSSGTVFSLSEKSDAQERHQRKILQNIEEKKKKLKKPVTIFLDSYSEKETEQPLYSLARQGKGIKVTWNEVIQYLHDSWLTVRLTGRRCTLRKALMVLGLSEDQQRLTFLVNFLFLCRNRKHTVMGATSVELFLICQARMGFSV